MSGDSAVVVLNTGDEFRVAVIPLPHEVYNDDGTLNKAFADFFRDSKVFDNLPDAMASAGEDFLEEMAKDYGGLEPVVYIHMFFDEDFPEKE